MVINKEDLCRGIERKLEKDFGMRIPVHIKEDGKMYYSWHSLGENGTLIGYATTPLKHFSFELCEDLQSYYGLSPEVELVHCLSQNIAMELPPDYSRKLEFILFRIRFGR